MTEIPNVYFSDNLLQMVGKKFLKEISTDDATRILEILKKHGDENLIDKWVSVNIVAGTARGRAAMNQLEKEYREKVNRKGKTSGDCLEPPGDHDTN
jgi:hypothetical protein